MEDCIFCDIAAGKLPSKTVLRDPDLIAIEDINPQAPVHVLVMPIRHYANVAELVDDGDGALLAKLMATATDLGRKRGGEAGFRLVVNTGADGGQTVDHLHLHVLAGRFMDWPPG